MGEPIEISYGIKLLYEAVESVGGEKITLEIRGSSSPLIIRPSDDSTAAIAGVMPIRK